MRILVDADACPVKAEVYRVAERYGLEVFVVTNGGVMVPRDPRIQLVIVGEGFDAADDWIAERAGPADIVVTADIPLADRCLKTGATVIGPTGRPFTKDSIGMALASRALMADLRAMGVAGGGNKPMSAKDKSAFLSALDAAVVRLRRSRPQA
ncbi:YaiI/YqxD family protein [Inquilinus limosus]|uniref:YaiI/YqxD family protein n=1 Tax=Inquilinus limosus TaxID=171674 RepID=UPI003F5CCC81